MHNSSLSHMVNNELHISHSQIFTYLNCSLKYRFQYVENKPPERISIALPFGTAIHAAIEMYYRSLKNDGSVEPLKALCERFQTCPGTGPGAYRCTGAVQKGSAGPQGRCGDGQRHAQSVSREHRPNRPYHPGDRCCRASTGSHALHR